MFPRIFKRWKTTAPPRKGRKGRLYITERPHPPPTPEEEVRIVQRRHKKAERDERMDITLALTPPKTYMGGFTRPRDLRASNWFSGGPYVLKGKAYESPPEAAYEPHTVFLLETRYRVRHGVGRVDSKDHVTAVCRAVDFVKLMAKYNSTHNTREAVEAMDNACWPFLPRSGKVLRPTKWWGPGERLEDIMKEIYEGGDYDEEAVRKAILESEEEIDDDASTAGVTKKQKPIKYHKTAAAKNTNSSPLPTSVSSPVSEETGELSSSSPLDSTSEPQRHMPPAHGSRNILPPSPIEHPQQCSLSKFANTDGMEPQRPKPPHLVASHESNNVHNIRAQYLPRLGTEPFWRPLLAITVSTRPLALTLSRLAKAHERGLPYYAAMSNDDRKCLISFGSRMTNVRLNRFLQLTRKMTRRLAGYKGGFVGIRFDVNERGRGINGEGLADPIPLAKRVVKVQVGRWYPRAEEVYELFEKGGEEWGGPGALEVSYMNDWGRRLDDEGNEVPLTAEEMSPNEIQETVEADLGQDQEQQDGDELESDDSEVDQILRNPQDPVRRRKLKSILRGEDETSAVLRRKLALKQAQSHRSVERV